MAEPRTNVDRSSALPYWLLGAALGGGVAGIAVGLVGARILYGNPEPVRPAPPRTIECPPCEPCPVMPPCRTGQEMAELPDVAPLPEPSGPDPATGPGLFVSTVEAAQLEVAQAVGRCPPGDGMGLLLLEITVTGTTARFSVAEWTMGRIDPQATRTCIVEELQAARFAATEYEGRGTLKVPVRLSTPSSR